jgi:hypothetical protein
MQRQIGNSGTFHGAIVTQIVEAALPDGRKLKLEIYTPVTRVESPIPTGV